MNAKSLLVTSVSVLALAGGALSLTQAMQGSAAYGHNPVTVAPSRVLAPRAAPAMPSVQPPPSDPSYPSTRHAAPAQTTRATSTPATGALQDGVVLVNAVVDYGEGKAAGTGLVMDSDGIVVTNHHVVADSTSVTVTIPATGVTYDAEVLGYSTTADVAVLRLDGASNLTAITTDGTPVQSGDSVTAVGNAEGGNALLAVPGHVTDLNQTITATDDSGNNPETLTDLIEVDAPLVPGDSGGAMFGDGSGVIGMNVAGSRDAGSTSSYAIPIDTVQDVMDQVLSGGGPSVTTTRTPALGVLVSSRSGDALVVGVMPTGPAAQAGLTTGSTITALGNDPIGASADLSEVLATHTPGQVVSLTWTDPAGRAHTAQITLGEAPLP